MSGPWLFAPQVNVTREQLDDNFGFYRAGGFFGLSGGELANSVTPVNFGFPVGDVRRYGADPTGVLDSGPAFATAALVSRNVWAQNATYRLATPSAIPAGRVLNIDGSDIILALGAGYAFTFIGNKEGLKIVHGGGTITGTAAGFVLLQGTTNQPTNSAHYARGIRMRDVYITSATITVAINMLDAVRQVFLSGCFFFTASGINASGKTVEIHMDKCLLYSSTNAAGTFGIKLRSTGGTSFYNEGWHISTCTIDQFDVTFDLTDIFVLTCVNSYVGSIAAGYALQLQAPSTTACREVNFGNGCVFGGRINVVASAGGQSYFSKIEGCIFTGQTGVHISIGNNAAFITVRNVKFESSANGIAVVSNNNNQGIVVDGVDCDTTFIGGVQINGANGTDCAILNLTYAGTGNAFDIGRFVRLGNVPMSATTAPYLQAFNPASLAGAYIVGAVISTATLSFAKNERGKIYIKFSCTGMNAATQRFDIGVPAGMVCPSGTGWSSQFIMPDFAAGPVYLEIPYYMTADVAGGNVTITNGAGNTVTLDFHSYFGVVKDN